MATEFAGLGVTRALCTFQGSSTPPSMTQKARATWMMLFCWGFKGRSSHLGPLPDPWLVQSLGPLCFDHKLLPNPNTCDIGTHKEWYS